jgi:pSer/pThr/pTyr-binding forkhead associated (FHA) protein
MARLTFALEDGQEVIVPLTERLTLGRDEDNDIVVNDDRLSPRHAEILPHPSGSYEVRDLGSATGTFVNDQRVQTCRLMQADRLAFGPLTAVLDLEAPASASTSGKAAPSPEAIAAAEERLTHWQAAARQSEAAHQQWLSAIAELTSQHGEKTAALQQLSTDLTAAQEKLSTLTTRQQDESTRLAQLQRDSTQAETRLSALRQQITDLDQRLQDGHARLATQNEDISAAEHTLTRLEQSHGQLKTSLQALTDTESRLAQAQTHLQDTQTQHTALTAAIALLTQDQQQRETRLRQLLTDLQSTEAQLTTRRRELATETQRLEEAQRRRTGLEQHSHTLATQQRAEPAPLAAKPAPAVPPPPAAPAPSTSQATRPPRIVAIDAPRFTVIPMKSEHVVKRSPDAPPRKGR